MNNFKFDLPTKIYFGSGEFLRIKKVLKEYLNKKALVLIGQNSVKKFGYLSELEKVLTELKIKYEIFEGVEPNPKHTTLNKASEFAKKTNCEFIIAFGGGSVMDGAKAVAISAINGEDVWNYCYIKGKQKSKIEKALPIVCIPTLAATGSECDSGAVISNTKTLQKAVIHSDKVFPKYAVIDPDFLKTVPINYMIDGAVDIMCHSLESFFSNENEAKLQDLFSYSICRTVKISIDEIISSNNSSTTARENIFWASSVAMAGFLNGRNGAWPMHEMEHGVSAIYDISHGLGLAYIMLATLKYNTEKSSSNYNNKVLKFIGFFLHENTNYYKDIETAYSDYKNYFYSINAIRYDDSIKNLNENIICESILNTYASNDNFIHGLFKYDADSIRNILLIAKNL